MIWPPGSPRVNGCSAPIGGRMTIRPACAVNAPSPDLNQRLVRGVGLTNPASAAMNEISKVTEATAKAVNKPALPDAQTVTEVTHWTDRLFSFRVTRPASLRFRSGEFVMIGLMGKPHPDTGKQKPLLRAYSIASPSWDDELEFYSIKVQDGPLTSRLQHIEAGDQIILKPKPVGTLVHDALLPGRRIWFLSTGTGIAPFASLIRDPETYENYEQVILTHTCRDVAELDYGRELVASLREDPLIGEFVGDKLVYY